MSKTADKSGKWRKRIEDFLRDEGFTVTRQALYGANDQGDIHVGTAPDHVVIEAKNQARHSLAEWLDEANVEATNADSRAGVAWFHRRGSAGAASGYVLMDGRTFAYLLREAGVR